MKTIDDLFLDKQEREEVIVSLSNITELRAQMFAEFSGAFMIPRALYAASGLYEYKKHAEQCNPQMLTHFDWLYLKLKETLAEYYQKPVEFLDGYNYPGFHAFYGPINSIGYNSFHQDAFESIDTEIHSWVCPIVLPEYPTGIVFRDNSRFDYSEGMLTWWKGNISHAIGDVVCEQGEARITLQTHASITPDRVRLFW